MLFRGNCGTKCVMTSVLKNNTARGFSFKEAGRILELRVGAPVMRRES